MSATRRPLVRLTEKEWMSQVVHLARSLGWATYHPLISMRSQPGFPDLVMAKDRVIFVELKTDKGKLSEHQERWREHLQNAGAEYHLWRPDDAPLVLQTLRRRPPA